MNTEGRNYFAYGSNLLSTRMHVNNKDAIKLSLGRLKDWKFVFSGYSPEFWMGATANIIPSPCDEVIGVIWSVSSFEPLDRQEVHYESINVQVEDLKTGEIKTCRTYIQSKSHYETTGKTPDKPSKAYKNVILAGARESSLPNEYYNKLCQYEDNTIIPDHIVKIVPEAAGEESL